MQLQMRDVYRGMLCHVRKTTTSHGTQDISIVAISRQFNLDRSILRGAEPLNCREIGRGSSCSHQLFLETQTVGQIDSSVGGF